MSMTSYTVRKELPALAVPFYHSFRKGLTALKCECTPIEEK
jgi:hypothetical protein